MCSNKLEVELSGVKDTVLVSLWVPGGSRHVEQDDPGIVGLVDDDLVELDGRVHSSDVGVVPAQRKGHVNGGASQRGRCWSSPYGLMLSMSLKPSGVEQPECVARYCELFSFVQVI